MSIELKITKDFLEMTDHLISVIKEKNMSFENMNVLLVKVPVVSSSMIQLVEGKFMKDQNYQSGLARVIGVPRLLDTGTDANIQAGDFVIFSHASKYTLSPLVVHHLFGVKLTDSEPLDFVEANNSQPLIAVSDRDIITVIPLNSMTVSE